jgi:hypothetical protein
MANSQHTVNNHPMNNSHNTASNLPTVSSHNMANNLPTEAHNNLPTPPANQHMATTVEPVFKATQTL